MSLSISQTIKNATASARLTAMRTYNQPYTLKMYNGPVPVNITDSITNGNTSLVDLTLFSTVGTVATDTITLVFNDNTYQINATGSPTFGRLVDSNSSVMFQGTAGGTGSGSDFIFTTLPLTQGTYISPQVTTLQEP
jgi:hypothetical protein